jgi:hypothetical protein
MFALIKEEDREIDLILDLDKYTCSDFWGNH